MRLLLDTNVFIWASVEPDLLSTCAREALGNSLNERYVSAASLWEMQIKHSLGKLPLPANVDQLEEPWLRLLVARLLPIEVRHLGKLYDLPPLHRDPFDRLLVAQAMAEGLTLVTADPALGQYGVPII